MTDAESCGTTINHAVTAIGYGTDDTLGIDYLIFKNSWATDWGDSGYGRISISDTSECGVCAWQCDVISSIVLTRT